MKSALLIIDMQNDFIKDTSPYSCQMLDNNLIDRIFSLIESSREIGIKIIYTQHSINPDKSNAEVGEHENVRACIIGTKGWEIIEKLKPRKDLGDMVIRKDKYDAFYGTELEEILKNENIENTIICGVLTNNCIRATAEGGHYRGFKLTIVKDCCGATSYIPDYTNEEIHDVTIRDLAERIYDTNVINLADYSLYLKNIKNKKNFGQKIQELREAVKDSLFMNDLKETSKVFNCSDSEVGL